MADRVLTAEARITASDRTGGIFNAIAAKIAAVTKAAASANRHSSASARATALQIAAVERSAARRAAADRAARDARIDAVGVAAGRYIAPAAAAVAAAQGVKRFAELERSFERVGITADASAAEVKAAWADANKIAHETAQPLDAVIRGYETLAAQGRKIGDIREFLPSVARTAQATGSEIEDIAKTAEAVGTNFKIAGKEMQHAFDLMAAGGKAGQFELKDMARYLPSLAPAAAAVGFKGAEGLAELVSMLQIIRKGTGTAEEAAASFRNIITKLESKETAKNLKEFGVDAPAAFAKARKEGRNLIETFEDLIQQATKGDASLIPKIIADQEFARGVLALQTYRGEWQKLAASIRTSAPGSVLRDLDRVLAGTQTRLDRAAQAADKFRTAIGSLAAIPAGPALEELARLTKELEEALTRWQRARGEVAGGPSPVLRPGQTPADPEREARIAADRARAEAIRAERSIDYDLPPHVADARRKGRRRSTGGSRFGARDPLRGDVFGSDREWMAGEDERERLARIESDRLRARGAAAARGYFFDTDPADPSKGTFVPRVGRLDETAGPILDARRHFEDLKGAARHEASKVPGGVSVYDARRRLDEIERELTVAERVAAHNAEKRRRGLPIDPLSDDGYYRDRVKALVPERERLQAAAERKPPPTAEEIGAAVAGALNKAGLGELGKGKASPRGETRDDGERRMPVPSFAPAAPIAPGSITVAPSTVTGEATIRSENQIAVDVRFNTPMLEATVGRIVDSKIAKLNLRSKDNGPGSTGTSSPDAAP